MASFSSIGAIIDGGRLVATIPTLVAMQMLELRPHLRVSALPFAHKPGSIDLLWPKALDGDPACMFVRDAIVRIAEARDKRAPVKATTARAAGRTR